MFIEEWQVTLKQALWRGVRPGEELLGSQTIANNDNANDKVTAIKATTMTWGMQESVWICSCSQKLHCYWTERFFLSNGWNFPGPLQNSWDFDYKKQ